MESDDVKSVIPLPDELLTELISRFIPLSQWSRSLEYVSRQFQRCVLIAYGRIKSMKCIKLFSLTKFKRYKDSFDDDDEIHYIRLSRILEKLLTVCPNLADIVSVHFTTSSWGVHQHCVCWDSLAQFDRLQSLSLVLISCVNFRSFAYFVANSKSLKILNVTCCSFGTGGKLNVGSLSVVSFRYGMKLMGPPDICLENLSEKLTDLTVHSLEIAFKADRDAMKHCRNLERLSVSLYKMNDYEIFLSNLPNLCKLTSLQINGYYYKFYPVNPPRTFNEKFSGHLNFLKNQLRCIEFSTDVVLSEEVQNFLLAECLQLQSLVFNELSANAVKNLRRLPANLKQLTFKDDNAETLPILLPHLVKLMNLTDLTITDFYCDDWKKWENICCLVNLQNLRMYNRYVTDALVQAWDRKNPEMFEKLATFEIQYAHDISDVGGILIASKARNLKRLGLWASRISEKTLLVLADFAKNLVETDLRQTEPLLFDENAIISLINKATRLKKIKVSDRLAEKIIANENFLPLAENVEIESNYGIDTNLPI